MSGAPHLSWAGILRLGLVQTSIGAVVVLTTSAINRVMVVELALPALLPGLLVGLHYAVQLSRPRMGHGSDGGARRAPWIAVGMALLSAGGLGAAAATAWMETNLAAGIAAALLAFLAIGLGVGAAGTSLLALLASRVAPARRAAAASVVWMMMIAGFVLTTAVAGALLDPYSPARLVAVSAGVCGAALLLALLALRGMEPEAPAAPAPCGGRGDFRAALAACWGEPGVRRFTLFVFVSMLAYAAQDLVLEPFAGLVFGMTLGETTRLASVQHAGVLGGMALAALLAGRLGSLRAWTVWGCVAAGASVALLVLAARGGPGFPIHLAYLVIGVSNGAFAAAAIASMMALAGEGGGTRSGLRIGLWGAAQAVAFGLGGVLGTGAADLARLVLGAPGPAYALVFAADAALFWWAAVLASGLGAARAAPRALLGRA